MSDVMDASTLVLPWSREAEQSALGALLLEPGTLDRIGPLSAGDFFHTGHGRIFDAVRALVAAHQPVDVITVFEALQDRGEAEECGGLAYLNALAQSVPSAANARRYAETVREKAARRALLGAVDQALQIARGKDALPEALDRIASLFGSLQRTHISKAPRHIGEIALERSVYYTALADGEAAPGWPTHIPALDRALNGGLQPGRLYVLAARPAVGKSSFALQLCASLARDGHPALFLSQEMSEGEVADRAVTHAGRLDYGALLSGGLDHDGWTRAVDALDDLSRLPIYVADQPALRLDDIKAKARQIKGLHVVVVDYLQLCAASAATAGTNRNAQVEEISRGLKALAKDLGVAVIALSQLNRQVEQRIGKRPQLGDLRDSGAVEQDADVVAFLWPVRELDGGAWLVGCEVAKNRQGRCTAFALNFLGPTQRWHESTESLEPTAKPDAKRKDFE